MGPKHICSVCGEKAETFWAVQQEDFICSACQRLYNPPYMTLMKFTQGSFNRLWNLEVGEYEQFKDVEEIESCGWFTRSRQETLFNLVPRVTALVYHLEYFGEAACGRCISYPYFESDDDCLPTVCKKLAKPFKQAKDIQYPPERSRYTKWMNL